MARRPAGAAAQRLEVAECLRELPVADRRLPLLGGSSPVVAGAGLVAIAVGLSRDMMAVPLGIAVVLLTLAVYVVLLRLALLRSGAGRRAAPWRLLGPALVPASCVVGSVALLETGPGWPWTWAIPVWVGMVLAFAFWLEQRVGHEPRPGLASTVLVGLLVTLAVPYFLTALTPGLPLALSALAVGVGCLVPTWRMVLFAGLGAGPARERAAIVALIMAGVLIAVVELQVASPLLLVALLVGWYGLAGVAGLRDRSELPSFAAFVVLAAAILAISAPA